MQWSADKPKIPGWYWYKKHRRHSPSLVEVYVSLAHGLYVRFADGSGTRYAVGTFDGEWAGQLEPPQD